MNKHKLKGIAERKLEPMRQTPNRTDLFHFVKTGIVNESFLVVLNGLVDECSEPEKVKKEVTNKLVTRIETEINNTPTGDLRNLLCDVNIVIQALIGKPDEPDNTKKIAWWGYQTKRRKNDLCNNYFFYAEKEVQDLTEADIEYIFDKEHF